MFQVIIESWAQKEWDKSVAWYEEREAGVGLRFNRVVRDYLNKIKTEYARFPFVGPLTQKAKIPDWPYNIYFVVNHKAQHIKVVAIWEGHQNPSKLRRRLG